MGLFSGIGDFLTGGNSQSLGRTADEMLIDVNTPGASVSFDADSNALTSKLDPRHKAFQDLLFNIGSGLLNNFQTGNFNQEAQNQFDLLSNLGRQDRIDQRLGLESRLFNQGLLGTTAGANQFNALQDSLAQQELQRELVARNFANQQRALMFQQGLQGLGGITTLDDVANSAAGLSQLGAGRANLLAQERLQSQDIGAGLVSSAIQGASGFFGGGLFG